MSLKKIAVSMSLLSGSAPSGVLKCFEGYGFKADPTLFNRPSFAQDCAAFGNTYSTEPCPRTNVVGRCRVLGDRREVVHYYHTGMVIDGVDPESSCKVITANGGPAIYEPF